MNNFEYYEKEIEEVKYFFGMINGKIWSCEDINCMECKFSKDNNMDDDFNGCNSRKIKWLYEEHIDKPKLTPTERKFVEVCQYEYYARDWGDDYIHIYEEEPYQREYTWDTYSEKYINCYDYDNVFGVKFDFITWEAGKYWTKEELLALEVDD